MRDIASDALRHDLWIQSTTPSYNYYSSKMDGAVGPSPRLAESQLHDHNEVVQSKDLAILSSQSLKERASVRFY